MKQNCVVAVMVVAALGFALAGCGSKRSDSGIEILNIEFFGDGKPAIQINDPQEGFRVLHVGDKVNGLEVLEADDDSVTFMGLGGERVVVGKKK